VALLLMFDGMSDHGRDSLSSQFTANWMACDRTDLW
jgi:hypothetical protein